MKIRSMQFMDRCRLLGIIRSDGMAIRILLTDDQVELLRVFLFECNSLNWKDNEVVIDEKNND